MFRKLTLILLLLFLLALIGCGKPATRPILINGAGATFPYPLYSKWFDEYAKIRPEIRFNYQSIGSGAGIRQIIERTVDFGATDAPMTDEQLQRAKAEILHIPTVLGAVVVTYNIPELTKPLQLTPETLSAIFLGHLTRWNDSRLVKTNPGVALPDKEITIVRRSDGSGTTFVFTDYLSSISSEWQTKVGKGTAVNWPSGIGAKGNEGVAGQVKQIPYSIGYVELAYAIQSKLGYAAIQNKDGKFVLPTLESITEAAAATAATIPPDLRTSIINPPGEKAYPIAAYTYILVYKEQDDPMKGKAIAEFLWWAFHRGEKYAADLLYAPLPQNVVKLTEAKIKAISYQGKPLL